MSSALPSNPNLSHLKKQAKDLLGACRSGDPQVCSRLQEYLPRFSYGSPQGDWSLGVATFYSHVGPRAGGRLIVEGSHRLLQSFFEQLKPSERLSKRLSDRFFRSHPYFAELTGKTPPKPERVRRFMGEETEIDGVAVRVLELTGEPGDAVLYHRGL